MVATLRTHRMGDLGWAIQRHAELYRDEYRYLPVFEEYVVQTFAAFLEGFDPAKDRMWVAELDGRRVGMVAVHHDPEQPGWCKFRWFFVEKDARGHGVGSLLMKAALDFARSAGYEGIWLWTVDDLVEARRQYERAGFRLVRTEAEPCEWAPWGHEQRWELPLQSWRR